MNIPAEVFYEQGLKPYADQIFEDRYIMMAIDTTDGKNELAACRIGKDMVSVAPSLSSEIDKIPIMNARSHLMKYIAKELLP